MRGSVIVACSQPCRHECSTIPSCKENEIKVSHLSVLDTVKIAIFQGSLTAKVGGCENDIVCCVKVSSLAILGSLVISQPSECEQKAPVGATCPSAGEVRLLWGEQDLDEDRERLIPFDYGTTIDLP